MSLQTGKSSLRGVRKHDEAIHSLLEMDCFATKWLAMTKNKIWIATSQLMLLLAMTLIPVQAAWFNGDWSSREKITIKASQINGDLSEFPVYLNLADLPNTFFATVNGTGADIRMTLADEVTETSFELVEIDVANGTGELWFKAPVLSSIIDTDFYIYYGNPTATAYSNGDSYGYNDVWSNGYVAVYHLNEDPSGIIKDSTRFNNSGVSNGGMTNTNLVSGQIGKSIDFDGSNDKVTINSGSLLGSQFSLSLWINPNLLAPNDNFVGVWDSSGWLFRTSANTTASALEFYDGSSNFTSASSTLTTHNWQYLHTKMSSSSYEVFKDGIIVAGPTNGQATPTTNTVTTIGSLPNTIFAFPGKIDNVSFSNKARSDDWISSEYKNQNSPGNFYLVENGNDAGFDNTRWSNSHKITILASQVNGDLTNFPIYINLDHLPSNFFSTVGINGSDIRMTTSDRSTQIPFELVELDIPGRKGELWFKAPFLSSSTDTDFYLWYGNPTAVAYDRDDEFGSENVWTEGYVGVWHMNEDPSQGQILDSTAYRHHGTNNGSLGTSNLVKDGLGKSINFNGANSFIKIEDSDELDLVSTDFTVSTWVKAATNPLQAMAISKKNTIWSQTDGWETYHSNAVGGIIDFIGGGGTFKRASGLGMFNDGNWHQYNLTGKTTTSTKITTYVDNIERGTNGTVTNITPSSDHMRIGARDDAFLYYSDSVMDEIRISKILRDSSWLKAEFINQKNSKKFYNIDNGIEDDGEAWVSADWTNRLKITIGAAQVNGTHTDFPVFIDLADLPANFFTTVQANGEDIRITSADGQTRLAVDVVNINTALQRGELHFKAPLLTNALDNDFYIYYGNPNAHMPNGADPLGSQAVWSNGYVAVYHMNQDPSPTGALILDSTSYRNHGRPQGSMTLTDLVNGQIGMALDFDGTDDEIISSFLGTNTNGPSSVSKYSISAWVKADTGANQEVIAGWWDGADGIFMQSRVAGGSGLLSVAGDGLAFGQVDFTTTNWTYAVLVYDGTLASDSDELKLFANSTQQTLTFANTIPDSLGTISSNFTIGDTGSLNRQWDGIIDEVRISNKTRSREWIDTEYNNHNSPSSFYTIESTPETNTDDNAPKVLKLIPDTKTTDTPRRHPLRMLFDKVVNVGTGNVNIYQENGNLFESIAIGSGQVTGGGTTELIITPSTYFTNAQTYYVLIDPAAIKDTSLNDYAGISDPETWKFTIQGGVKDQKPLHIFDRMI